MDKATASSIFGLIAVPPTLDATPTRSVDVGGKKQRAGTPLFATMAGIAFAERSTRNA